MPAHTLYAYSHTNTLTTTNTHIHTHYTQTNTNTHNKHTKVQMGQKDGVLAEESANKQVELGPNSGTGAKPVNDISVCTSLKTSISPALLLTMSTSLSG